MEGHNLSCIVTFPPYRRQKWGTLLMELSYELCRRRGTSGTPERPLSAAGQASFSRFWISRIVRFLSNVLINHPSNAREEHYENYAGTALSNESLDVISRAQIGVCVLQIWSKS